MQNRLKVVVIGGVAGGATAAAKARRVSETAEILMYEKGQYVSFANCGLPYYVGGTIQDRSKLFLQNPEGFWNRYKVKVHPFHEVLAIHPSKKTISIRNLQTNQTFEDTYSKLILSPGAGAVVPPLPGVNSKNVFTVKTVPDADNIMKYIKTFQPKHAVVIGAGFIGLETAEALHNLGVKVTVVEMLNQILPPFDADMAKMVQHHIEHAGIQVSLNDGVKGFRTENDLAVGVTLNTGKELPCDLVILSIGVRPEIKLAKEAGLKIGVTGGIEVNEYQQTSDPDIYAVGDAVQTMHMQTKKPIRMALAGPANRQGRIAGSNSAIGNKLTYKGTLGTSIVECLGITAALTGLSEKQCVAENIDYFVTHIHPMDHASYYPGAHMLHMKLIVEKKTGKILGGQIVGETGVDKRIDVIATAIAGNMTTEQIESLDLAYSPQYGTANDPVIMAAFTSNDVLRGDVSVITYGELVKMGKDIQLVDVRTPSEYSGGHLEGSILIPVDELRTRLSELQKDKPTVVYCRVGLRGYIASRILLQNDFKNVMNLTGGYLSATLNDKLF